MWAVSQSQWARGMRASCEPCQIPTGVVISAGSNPQGQMAANWSSIHPSRLSAKVARSRRGRAVWELVALSMLGYPGFWFLDVSDRPAVAPYE
jgi:hypothetical protein